MTEQVNTLVVGAGPSGLAVAACLTKANVPHVVLERAATAGSTWRAHYDRLHLHTAKQYSGLPYTPWPKEAPRYPSRAEVVAYLERYAEEHQIAPRFGVDVEEITAGWTVRTSSGELAAKNVVMASGCYGAPFIADVPGLKAVDVPVIHTSAYKDPAPFVGKKTLVVGSGNSGAEIALDLCEHGVDVSLVVRGPVHVIPRDLFGLPLQAFSLPFLPVALQDVLAAPILSLALGDLTPLGITRPKQGVIRTLVETGRAPLIDVGTIDAIRAGKIKVVPGVARFEPQRAVLANGNSIDVGAVIMATGFKNGLDRFFKEPVDPSAPPPRLHFIGFKNRGTGILREIGQDSVRVARAIAQQPDA